eukprot:CAMPEP_0170459342 /NCGR_PEP_ID=MMETSP0123-20130129/6073_1 /TAXON_ID=182087 /ORGANISM="Favella ehrenbergii, Strain Fehren 1" /LENGTH=56 /DNA_ID=CAMNT_0010723917 /DNA_START=291 /DNA_END=461 /DNA_ORIENTATION=+
MAQSQSQFEELRARAKIQDNSFSQASAQAQDKAEVCRQKIQVSESVDLQDAGRDKA